MLACVYAIFLAWDTVDVVVNLALSYLGHSDGDAEKGHRTERPRRGFIMVFTSYLLHRPVVNIAVPSEE